MSVCFAYWNLYRPRHLLEMCVTLQLAVHWYYYSSFLYKLNFHPCLCRTMAFLVPTFDPFDIPHFKFGFSVKSSPSVRCLQVCLPQWYYSVSKPHVIQFCLCCETDDLILLIMPVASLLKLFVENLFPLLLALLRCIS
jgi:hypothetical protein